MSDNASGNWILNQVRIASRECKRPNSAVGAKRVHVNDLSWEVLRRYIGHRIAEYRRPYFVWESYQHERMPRPYVQVIRVQKECRLPICVRTCRHFEFKVLVRDILLMIVHSMGAQGLNILCSMFDAKKTRTNRTIRISCRRTTE
jgi:hypothetical protein